MKIEEKILETFKKKLGAEAKKLNLMVSLDPEAWEEDHYCEVMEKQDNGKVWEVKTTRSGKVIEIYEI